MSYNKEQLAVINHKTGPLAVAAGAGSGKTASFVNRIAELIKDGVNPHRILGVTFTKAAADSMKERLAQIIGQHETQKVRLGTIHSWCLWVVRNEFPIYKPQFEANPSYIVIKNSEIKEIFSNFLAMNNRQTNDKKKTAKELVSAIGLAKNHIIRPAESAEFFRNQGLADPEFLSRAYAYYQTQLASIVEKRRVNGQWVDVPTPGGKLDFDDMLLKVHDLFASNPEALARWASQYDYVLVDECQDCSPVQIKIIEQLLNGAGHTNVMLIGDLRQSIYKFRGAAPDEMQKFFKRIGADVKDIDTNYRSKSEIIELSNRIADNMKDLDPRFRTHMKAGRN